MERSYHAVLHGDRLEWAGDAPDSDVPVSVRVTVLDDRRARDEMGRRMAAALERLAESRAFDGIEDPVAWQRDVRRDHDLPGRRG